MNNIDGTANTRHFVFLTEQSSCIYKENKDHHQEKKVCGEDGKMALCLTLDVCRYSQCAKSIER